MSAWQDIRCPKCDKLLCQAFGISAHLLIRIMCRCGRLLQVKEGFLVEVISEGAPSQTRV
jgi:phage FluMu protein Com